MKNKTLCVLTLILIMSTSSAFGGIKEGSLSLSPLLGGYIFGDNQQLNASPVVGIRAGYSITKTIGVEALYDYVLPTDSKFWSIKDISMHRFGAQGLYHFLPDNPLVPYLAVGSSGVNFRGNNVNPHTHLSFDYGAGAKYFIADNVAVRADLRHIWYDYNSAGYNNVEFMLGATFQFGGGTPASKPIVTAGSTTSETAGTAPVLELTKAAPTPAARCEPVACTPVPAQVVCPSQSETLKTLTTPVTKEACEPFLVAAAAKASSAAPVVQTCSAPAPITVLFSYEKADVKQKYYEALNQIGNFLKNFVGSKVTIEGHTSAMGDKDANLKLSQERADTVKSHLMYKFGIDGSRITAKGYGLSRPTASNKTTRGRMQNRRIVAVFTCE